MTAYLVIVTLGLKQEPCLYVKSSNGLKTMIALIVENFSCFLMMNMNQYY